MCFEYFGNSICGGRCFFSIYVQSFFGLSTLYVCFPSWFASLSVSFVSPLHLGRIVCVTFCVSHFESQFCAKCVIYNIVCQVCVEYVIYNKGPNSQVGQSDKYCMAHGCATRKNHVKSTKMKEACSNRPAQILTLVHFLMGILILFYKQT